MAEDLETLIRVRPFKSFDTRTNAVNNDPGNAMSAINADTHRSGGALSNFYGRTQLWTFASLGPGATISQVTRYDVGPARQFFLVQNASGSITSALDVENQVEGAIYGITTPYTASVQANGRLWLNNGQQVFYGQDDRLHAALWQYPEPPQSNYQVTNGGAGTLPAGTYYYAFVRVISLPVYGGTVTQSTTPVGAELPYPYTFTSDGAQQSVITGQLAGNTTDGYPYVTQVYRQSSNVAVWYLLTTLTNNDPYFDNATDQSISANQQLILRSDPPPTGGDNGLNPLEVNNNSVWILALQNNVNTDDQPQMQLWYSEVGQPWSFDAVNQVELVGNDQTTLISSDTLPPDAFGGQAMGLAQVGSYLGIFKGSDSWLNVGVDEQTYQALPLFNDIGTQAPDSLAKGNGMIFWLDIAQGVFSYDGQNLSYLSNQIYNALQQLTITELTQAVGFFCDLSYFLSFASANITFVYYLPTKEWTTLSYATTAVAYASRLPSNPLLGLASWKTGQIVAARPGTATIDAWMDGREQDLGMGTAVTWATPYTDSGKAWSQKVYRWIYLMAENQAGTVIVTLNVDPLDSGAGPITFPATFQLDAGPMTQFVAVPEECSRGYLANLVVTFTTPLGATEPIQILEVGVGGSFDRPWTPPS